MIGAIVLAAGQSRRYGPANKLFAHVDGDPLLARVLRVVATAPVRPITVVTGAARPRVHALCRRTLGADARLRLCHAPQYAQGLSYSLRAGLKYLPPGCDAALVCLGDMPAIDARLLQRLLHRWQPGLDYVRAIHKDRPGHPVILSRRLFHAIHRLEGDHGAQSVLARVPTNARCLIASHGGCLLDVDTPRLLRRPRRYCRLGPGPPPGI